mmetsp:Transcript_15137/g.38433  ORF Transcript_15137/g.38433 Transcript_15137/m.38433 type:complete len:224 (-) Transcript_15137:103-774(-)
MTLSHHSFCATQKDFIKTDVPLGRGLVVLRPNGLCILLCLGHTDGALLLQIDFVSHYTKDDVFAQHFPQLFHPVLDTIKGVVFGDVKHEQCSVGISVVDRTQCMKAFLTSSVPNGKSCSLTRDVDSLGEESRLNCGSMFLVKFILDIPHNKRGFPHTSFTKKNNFEFMRCHRCRTVRRSLGERLIAVTTPRESRDNVYVVQGARKRIQKQTQKTKSRINRIGR